MFYFKIYLLQYCGKVLFKNIFLFRNIYLKNKTKVLRNFETIKTSILLNYFYNKINVYKMYYYILLNILLYIIYKINFINKIYAIYLYYIIAIEIYIPTNIYKSFSSCIIILEVIMYNYNRIYIYNIMYYCIISDSLLMLTWCTIIVFCFILPKLLV